MVSSNDANLAGYVCAAFSITILFVRVVASRLKHGQFDVSAAICAVAILIIGARLGVVYFMLRYGTSNDALSGSRPYFDEKDVAHLKTGSILALIARLLITSIYWSQNCLLLLFYSKTIFQLRAKWHTILIRVTWFAIAASFLAVVLATLLECRPFKLYWQIDPHPGQCVRAYQQLLTQGITNIVLDLLLLAISYPVLAVRRRGFAENARVGTMFFLGFFCIIITCVRVAYIYAQSSYQPVRSFWASIQMLVSCLVANGPTTYGCLKLVRRRKSEAMQRRGSRPEIWLQLQRTNETAGANDVPVVDRSSSESPTESEKVWTRWIP